MNIVDSIKKANKRQRAYQKWGFNTPRRSRFHKTSNVPLVRPYYKGIIKNLYNTNDLKGCSLLGAENWNALKATVAKATEEALNGRFYVVPTIIACPSRGSGDSLTDELFGFNDDYAAMLGAKWYEKAWSGIKNFTKDTTHMALSAGAVIPITKPFVTAIRNVNDAGKNLLQQFGLIKKSSSEDDTATGAALGAGGVVLLAGAGIGLYFLLRDDKKKRA